MRRLILAVPALALLATSIYAIDERPPAPTVKADIPQSLETPRPEGPPPTPLEKSDPKVVEAVGRLKCGQRIEVAIHLHGPEGGARQFGTMWLKGRLGPVTSAGFYLAKKARACDQTKVEADEFIAFTEVVSLKKF